MQSSDELSIPLWESGELVNFLFLGSNSLSEFLSFYEELSGILLVSLLSEYPGSVYKLVDAVNDWV